MASNQPLGAVERERSAIVGQATLPTGRAQTAREEAGGSGGVRQQKMRNSRRRKLDLELSCSCCRLVYALFAVRVNSAGSEQPGGARESSHCLPAHSDLAPSGAAKERRGLAQVCDAFLEAGSEGYKKEGSLEEDRPFLLVVHLPLPGQDLVNLRQHEQGPAALDAFASAERPAGATATTFSSSTCDYRAAGRAGLPL